MNRIQEEIRCYNLSCNTYFYCTSKEIIPIIKQEIANTIKNNILVDLKTYQIKLEEQIEVLSKQQLPSLYS